MDNNKPVILPLEKRTGKQKELFFIWFASNIGILGLVYGAILVSFKLSFLQCLLAAAVGSLSFALVGYLGIPGKGAGASTFVLSRAAFGIKGNYIPTLIGWINLAGWLSVGVVTGTLTLLSLFGAFGFSSTKTLTVISLIIFSALIIVSSIFGQETLVKIQTWFTYVFGILTLVVLLLLIPKTNWGELLSMKSGEWLGSFLPAVSIIMAGTGISWTIAASDYSCYQNPNNSSKSIFASITLGAFIPLFVIIGAGVLMTTSVSGLSTSSNPIDAISHGLPKWMIIPYFITALGGLIPQCIIALKSARVNLETLNIKVNHASAVTIHALIMIFFTIYVLFISENFLGNFQTFLGLLGVGLASWAATFLIDYICIRKREGYELRLLTDKDYNQVNYRGVFSWLIGVVFGLLFTNSPFFNGPFAIGIFRDSSLGVILAFVVSGLISLILISYSSKKVRRNI
ncbi:purine-cytosine permease family protein [Scopulibacillus cellulosilyticus]|uniref:Purine-cytosine permease family protein n=1 Tax=Scopulibacillus cellulosilyticus TaxID=2665665 RepID=A0ABW2PTR1_9BACL